jgi:hypothetical protein
VGLRDALRKVLDPRGPAADVLTTDSAWKERVGLPISAPHRQRVELAAPAHAEAALAVASPRFVAASETPDVPRDRVRQVSAFIEECWSPVYATTRSTDMAEILRASETLVGWNVRQRLAASARAKMTAEQFAEVIATAQIQATDDFLVGYYETIVGNDSIVIDGKKVTGGTYIRSRNHYREATKNYVHWDKGVLEERRKAEAEMASRPIRNVRANLERVAGECLPMRRLLPNPRYDRKAAV